MKHWRSPCLLLIVVFSLTALALRMQERLWTCDCGRVLVWSGDINSSDNSQQLFDPYTFTHLEHGFIFIGVALLLFPAISPAWRFAIAMSVEAIWEIIENTPWIINRYRSDTISHGYTGDTILNSFGDIGACVVGIFVAMHLGFRRTLVLAIVIEVLLVAIFRDSLLLNILMLLYPIEAVKTWQSGH